MKKTYSMIFIVWFCVGLLVGCKSESQTVSDSETYVEVKTEEGTRKEELTGEESTEIESIEKESTEKNTPENVVENMIPPLRVNWGSSDEGGRDEVYFSTKKENNNNLEFFDLRFWENGHCASMGNLYISLESVEDEDFINSLSENEIIEYKGTKYYKDGSGAFFWGAYNIIDDKIYISIGDGESITLIMTTEGSLIVEAVTSDNDYLKTEIVAGETLVYGK